MGIEVLNHQTRGSDNAEHPQTFFCKLRQQGWICGKSALQSRIVGQLLERKCRDVGNCIHPAQEQHGTHRHDLFQTQLAPLEFDCDKVGNKIFSRGFTAKINQFVKNSGDLL